VIAGLLPAAWSAPAGIGMAALFSGSMVLCAVAARSGSMPQPEIRAWRAVAVMLGLMALNAALAADRHVALWLRDVAHDHGWYELRRPLQATAVGLFVGGLAVAVARTWRRSNVAALAAPTQAALAMGPVLLVVAALRAVSHHQTDRWLDTRVAGHGVGRWIEVLCLVVVLSAAGRRWSVARRRGAGGVRHV